MACLNIKCQIFFHLIGEYTKIYYKYCNICNITTMYTSHLCWMSHHNFLKPKGTASKLEFQQLINYLSSIKLISNHCDNRLLDLSNLLKEKKNQNSLMPASQIWKCSGFCNLCGQRRHCGCHFCLWKTVIDIFTIYWHFMDEITKSI